MSAISSEFRKLLPTFSSWEINPEPPLQTSIINGVEGVEHRIEDLVGKLGGKSFPKCPKSKRGLFDDLFNIAAGAIDTIISALNCITRNTENLKKEIKDKDVEAAKDLLPRLISLDDKPTSTTTSAITYSTLPSIPRLLVQLQRHTRLQFSVSQAWSPPLTRRLKPQLARQ
jgi:hypothetical protein